MRATRSEVAEKYSDAGRVAPISVSVWCLSPIVYVLPDSSLCQNGKQVEIITKMIFELCYIEAIIYLLGGKHWQTSTWYNIICKQAACYHNIIVILPFH